MFRKFVKPERYRESIFYINYTFDLFLKPIKIYFLFNYIFLFQISIFNLTNNPGVRVFNGIPVLI